MRAGGGGGTHLLSQRDSLLLDSTTTMMQIENITSSNTQLPGIQLQQQELMDVDSNNMSSNNVAGVDALGSRNNILREQLKN